MAIIVVLLGLWLVCIIIGFTIKALLWLALLGLIFFVVTALIGAIRHFVHRD